jgi:UrcA family protein
LRAEAAAERRGYANVLKMVRVHPRTLDRESFMRVRTIVLLAASALALALTSAASAQDYGPYGPGYGPPVATVPTDQVIVIAPRYRVDHHSLNTPIENVSLSQPVRTDDLDLRTWQGARELRRRVHRVASNVCGQLIDMYPVGVDSDATCYRNAVAEAMPRADAAIQTARGYPPGLYGGR